MTTRGAWGLVVEGRAIVSPQAAEPGPSALGTRVLEWAREQQSWGEVRVRAQGLRLTDEGPDSDPGASLERGDVVHQEDLAYDTRACDWAYLVDLDDDAFEVYVGRPPKGTPPLGRFWEERPEWEAITRVAVWSLYALPTDGDFVAHLTSFAPPR